VVVEVEDRQSPPLEEEAEGEAAGEGVEEQAWLQWVVAGLCRKDVGFICRVRTVFQVGERV
jgi:hypothetical protein